MVTTVPEDMIMRDAPEDIRGEAELNAFREKIFHQQFDLVLGQPMNRERFGPHSPIARQTYENLTGKMKTKYDEKYDEEIHPPGLEPSFYIWVKDAPDRPDHKFTEAAARAQKVFESLRMNWVVDGNGSKTPHTQITSVIPLLASLKDSYIRTQEPEVKADIRRISNLLGFHLTIFDKNEVLMDCLIDSEQTPEHYQIVFTKLLTDEREAFIQGKPVLDRVDQYRRQLVEYFNKSGLYFPLAKIEDITFAEETGSFNPVGPIVESEYKRGSFVAIVKGKNDQMDVDPQQLTFVSRRPWVPLDIDPAVLDVEAVSFLATILHESIHFNGKMMQQQKEGSWEEAANELITDFATLTLLTQAGIGKGYKEDGSVADWQKKVGYRQLVRMAFRLEDAGFVTRAEIVKFGLNQNFTGFIHFLSHRLQQKTLKQRHDLIDSMDIGNIIGPDQYDLLMAKTDLTTEDLIRGVLNFGQEIGLFYYNQPNAILPHIQENLPEWKDLQLSQFVDWFRGEGGELGSATREMRHKLVRGFIQARQESTKKLAQGEFS